MGSFHFSIIYSLRSKNKSKMADFWFETGRPILLSVYNNLTLLWRHLVIQAILCRIG